MKQWSPSAQRAGAKQLWESAGVVTSKPTHGHRGAGARHAQEAGADIESIAQHGNWNHRRVATHYLSRIPSEVAMKLAGCTLPNERLWLPRATLIPSLELQRMVFPFIETYFTEYPDWLLWTENIMMDRSLFYNRPKGTRMPTTVNNCYTLRILVLLTRLRKVILQDAATLMDLCGDHQFRYEDHNVFKVPLFRSRMFMDFREQLRERMANAVSPVSDSLHANSPAIHYEFRSLNSKVDDVIQLLKYDFADNVGKSLERSREVWANTVSSAINNGVNTFRRDLTNTTSVFLDALKEISASSYQTLTKAAAILPGVAMASSSPSAPGPSRPNQAQASGRQLRPHTQQVLEPVEAAQPAAEIDLVQSAEQAQDTVDPGIQITHPRPTEGLAGVALAKEIDRMEDMLGGVLGEMPPKCHGTMLPRDIPLRSLWEEWFDGTTTQLPIWALNKHFRSKWRSRPGKEGDMMNHLYKYKRDIVRSVIKVLLLEAEGTTLAEKVESALLIVEDRVHDLGGLNKYYKAIQQPRQSQALPVSTSIGTPASTPFGTPVGASE
jgi:hypothetical protein